MEAGQEMLLAEVLSPSQVSQFLNCPAKWMFRYLLDLKEPGTAATALGRAFHETIAHNFRQKAEKKNGTRRTIEWVVGTDGSGDRKPQRRDQQPNGTAPAQRRGGGGSTPTNGNGHRPSSLSDAKGFLVTGHGQFLLQALAAAVDVASATERYAAACGLELQFTSEDLREIGLSIYTTGAR